MAATSSKPTDESVDRIYYVMALNSGWKLPQVLPLFVACNAGGACFKSVPSITEALYGEDYTEQQYENVRQCLKRLVSSRVLLLTEEVHQIGKGALYAGGKKLPTYRVNPELYISKTGGTPAEEALPQPEQKVEPMSVPTPRDTPRDLAYYVDLHLFGFAPDYPDSLAAALGSEWMLPKLVAVWKKQDAVKYLFSPETPLWLRDRNVEENVERIFQSVPASAVSDESKYKAYMSKVLMDDTFVLVVKDAPST